MVLCSDNCIPCCDFCIHVVHDEFVYPDGSDIITGGPIGCTLHPDKKHQEIAEGCGYCDDFHCFRV